MRLAQCLSLIHISKRIAKELLDKGWCRVTGLYTPKKPQLYDAVIRLEDVYKRQEKKRSEIEGQLKELYDKKTELENLEIINTVRSMVMDKDQIMAFLSSMKGGTKPAENTEVIDNA